MSIEIKNPAIQTKLLPVHDENTADEIDQSSQMQNQRKKNGPLFLSPSVDAYKIIS